MEWLGTARGRGWGSRSQQLSQTAAADSRQFDSLNTRACQNDMIAKWTQTHKAQNGVLRYSQMNANGERRAVQAVQPAKAAQLCREKNNQGPPIYGYYLVRDHFNQATIQRFWKPLFLAYLLPIWYLWWHYLSIYYLNVLIELQFLKSPKLCQLYWLILAIKEPASLKCCIFFAHRPL